MFSKVKKAALFTLPLLGVSSALFAGDISNRTQKLQGQMKAVRGETATGGTGAMMAPTTLNLEKAYGWRVNVDAVYWRPNIANNEFAQSNSGRQGVSMLPATGEMAQADYNWRWGFRIGLGKLFCYDNWELFARYTWFDSKSKSRLSAGPGSYVLPTRGNPKILGTNDTFEFCQNARVTGRLTYQAFDILLGRGYYVSSHLSFKPNWGLKFAWLKNNENVEYLGGDAFGSFYGLNGVPGSEGYPASDNVKVLNHDSFWSVGPRVGVNTTWHIADGVSFFADLFGSLLYTSHKLRYKNTFSPNPNTVIDVREDHHQFIPDIDANIGLRWDGYFNNDTQHLGIALGWEVEYLWDAIARGTSVGGIAGAGGAATGGLTRVAVGTETKSLSLQGLTIRFVFDF